MARTVELASFVSMRIGSVTAEFHFAKPNGETLNVAIPTEQLPRIVQEIESKMVTPAKPPLA